MRSGAKGSAVQPLPDAGSCREGGVGPASVLAARSPSYQRGFLALNLVEFTSTTGRSELRLFEWTLVSVPPYVCRAAIARTWSSLVAEQYGAALSSTQPSVDRWSTARPCVPVREA
jgi:hypothetical protein